MRFILVLLICGFTLQAPCDGFIDEEMSEEWEAGREFLLDLLGRISFECEEVVRFAVRIQGIQEEINEFIKALEALAIQTIEEEDWEPGEHQPLFAALLTSGDEVCYYYELPLTRQNEDHIHELIEKLSKKPLAKLALQSKRMYQLGNLVEGVHPLRFIGFVFTHNHLRECMRDVRKNLVKWQYFAGGCKEKLDYYADHGGLQPYIAGFCHQTQANRESIEYYIDHRDWEGLLRMFFR